MNFGKLSLSLSLLIITFIGVFWLGRLSAASEGIERVVVRDTIIYYNPIPMQSKVVESVDIKLPLLAFKESPKDTIVVYLPSENADSIAVRVDVEQRVYEDSTYYAVVQGAKIGNLHPELVELRTYNTTIKEKTFVKPKVGIVLGIGAGVDHKGRPTAMVGANIGWICKSW